LRLTLSGGLPFSGYEVFGIRLVTVLQHLCSVEVRLAGIVVALGAKITKCSFSENPHLTVMIGPGLLVHEEPS
jgi:hypothetical protein